jgi:uncharacterized membrane protein (DUF485 family)
MTSNIVDDLNSLIIDLSNNNPKQTRETDIIYYNIISEYNNYISDISFSDVIDEMSYTFASPYNSINGKKNLSQEKRLSINTYYNKLYDKKIKIIKEIIIICCIGLIGCFLLNNQVISDKLFSIYLGIVFSVGFILVFYDLWDLYIRDNTNFDEYDYNVFYNKKPVTNNIVNQLTHPLNFDTQTIC